MSYTYSEEYLQQMQAMREAQALSEGASKLNTVVMEYPNTGALIDQLESIPDYNGTAWYYNPVRNSAGEIVGLDYMKIPTSVNNPLAVIDSNVANPVFSDYTYDGTIGSAYGSKYTNYNVTAGGSGANTFSNGAKSVSTGRNIATAAGKVALSIGAVMMGAKLGKWVSEGLYDIGAGWQFNPDNWNTLLEGDDLDNVDKACLRLLLGLNDDNTATAYLDENALGSMYAMLLAMGAFDRVEQDVEIEPNNPISDYALEITASEFVARYVPDQAHSDHSSTITKANFFTKITYISPDDVGYMWVESGALWWGKKQGGGLSGNVLQVADNIGTLSSDARITYSAYIYIYDLGTSDVPINLFSEGQRTVYTNVTRIANYADRKVNRTIVAGKMVQGAKGISDDPRATYPIDPSLISGNTPQEIAQSIKQNYPDLWDGAIYEDVPQKDGTNKHITYVPVPWIDATNKSMPTTGGSQTTLNIGPDDYSLDDLTSIVDIITGITNPNLSPPSSDNAPTNPPPSGEGSSPVTTLPTGSASSLWAVYNPTQAEVNAFGSWLWSSDLVEQIKKLFNDPMQAIIGIHKVFVTPDTGGVQTIKCGYIDSQVSSKVVSSQYKTVNCGTVKLKEYFGNVFDYAPYTEVHLYLPFIGIVQLDVADVMRASITVKYHVDVITGACLVDVIVKRDDAGGVLYQYSGSAIVTYPLSSGSYASALAGVLSVVGGAVATFATKGIAPAITGAIVGGSKLHSDVQKSGTFTGAAGAMGGKKPYLIISRPQIALADNYRHFTGYPANENVTLKECYGYTKVKSIYVRNISKATDVEKDMLEAQLKAGVLVYLD